MSTSSQSGSVPTVSIVLPTYNQAHFLCFALDGILRQTFRDFELIVVNDGSTDGTSAVLRTYQEKFPFTVIDQANQKLPRALNTGFREARGKYLTWTSSDNIMLPNMLASLVSALDQNPDIGLVYSDWQIINELGKCVKDIRTLDFDPLLLMRINFINACFLYRRDVQDKIGLYNPDFYLVEDWEYWYRISLFYKMLHVPEVLYQYRVHANSLTRKEVLTKKRKKSPGYDKLKSAFQKNFIQWVLSKLKWEITRASDPERVQNLFIATLMH